MESLDMSRSHLLKGDCRERMKELPSNFFKITITDPPYFMVKEDGSGFMNRKWDSVKGTLPTEEERQKLIAAINRQEIDETVKQHLILNIPTTREAAVHLKVKEFHYQWAKEVYRVTRPGGFLFAFNSSRSDCMEDMIAGFRMAGWKVDLTIIAWTYASGWNKSNNLYVSADKRYFKQWIKEEHPAVYFPYLHSKLIESPRVKRDWAASIGSQVIEEQYEHPGRKNRSYQTSAEVFSKTRGDDQVQPLILTRPISDIAKKVESFYGGWQPKPAFESIIVAMKPMEEKTQLDQFVANGCGAVNLDRARIPSELTELVKNAAKGYCGSGGTGRYSWNANEQSSCKDSKKPPLNTEIQKEIKKMMGGRPNHKLGWNGEGGYKVRIPMKPRKNPAYNGEETEHGWQGADYPQFFDVDLRGRMPANLAILDDALGEMFSRYYSIDAWWEAQIEHLPPEQQEMFPFLYCPKPSESEKNKGLEDFETKTTKGIRANAGPALVGKDRSGRTQTKNDHPTIKAVKLISWLIALSPTENGDFILDPFGGSGTTGVAAKKCDRKFVLIEQNSDYHEIAKARIKAMRTQKNLLGFVKQ